MRYNSYSTWIRQQFPFRVQKIAVDAGFSCPNRKGHISTGGCIFCDNRTFNPSYCNPEKSITTQLEEGKQFFSHKYPDMKYLAYFQAYSNTYADIDTLTRRYEEALDVENVVGLVIGTRPDCISDELLDYLEELNRRTFLIVEYGIESVNDDTLRHINRGHDFECSRRAIELTHDRGILTGGHIILGLPGEDREENVRQASIVSQLKLDILKIHQLQIIRGTQLADEYTQKPFKLFTPDEYIDTCIAYLERLRSDIIVERKDRKIGFVVEVKDVKDEGKLDHACEAAMKQIEEKDYTAVLRRYRVKEIWTYGIAFWDKECRVTAKYIAR